MIYNKSTKVVAVLLCIVMLLSAIPMYVLASIPNWESENVTYDKDTFGTNGYYNVISKKDYVLVPGAATETEMVLNNAAGTRRQVLHIIEVDPSNPDVSLVPGYYNIDKDITDVANQQAAKLTDMAKYYEDVLGYNIVGGMNTDLYYAANAPLVLVYNGQDMRDYGSTSSVLCVYQAEDGTISVDVKAYSAATMTEELANGHATRGKLLHAVGVSFGMTVKDGELVSKTEERTSSAAARSMVGVKPDGTLVICMNDGRGANNSVGFCNYELGESMLALGCQWAANCDGGGSSTFISKRVGEDEFTMRSTPCDGAERPTIHGIFVASNVGPTGELDYAEIEAGYDYFAPGSSYKFDAKGIDTNGYQMDIPADATWALSDASFGTITADGIFASNGTAGDVDVQMVAGGQVIGSKTIHVANPTTLNLSVTSTVVPYSTADKVRTITMPIMAMIGEANVYYDTNVFEITLSDNAAGTLNGFDFTATTDESIEGVTITVKYIPTGTVMTYAVEFGKGSEIIWDFEDGELGGFLGQDDAYAWQEENGENPMAGIIAGGNRSDDVISESFLATKENGGQVHNGNYAVGYEIDMKNVGFNNWVYANVYNVSDAMVLRDVANGKKATALGMWVYVPEGFYTAKNAGALAMRFDLMAGTDENNLKRTNFDATYNGKKINSLTENDIPENRWIYISVNLTTHNYVRTHDPRNGAEGFSPNLIRMYVKPSEAQVLTYYFDNITLDYSSAVDDREPPVISDVTYCVTDTNIALDGNTINSNTVSFNANVADFVKNNAEGLDYTSAKVYIDGLAMSGVKASNGTMSLENVVLSNGAHKVTFEIADKLGNATQVSKTFTIVADNATSAITFGGHNDLGNVPEYDSVYYLDLVAADISKISSVTTEIALHTSSTWVLDQMILAEGFEATYTYNEISKIATITITKTDVCSLTGEQTLASIPTRVWSWDGYSGTTGPVVYVEAEVVSGSIAYTDNKTGSFTGKISVATKIDGNKETNAWHTHDAELTVLNKDATCTENGYANRTYCETCGSVVDWGTTIPATGHDYVLTNGQFVCSVCDATVALGTGLINVGGKTYYTIGGNLMTGWHEIDGAWYYFDATTFTTVETLNNGYVTFEFEDDGKLVTGKWYGMRYYYGPKYWTGTTAADKWVTIDGKDYCFNQYGYAMTGTMFVRMSQSTHYQWYDFGTDGAKIGTWDYTGLAVRNGFTYCVVDGLSGYGMFYMDGSYYYCASGNHFAAVKNIERLCPVTNGLLPVDTYRFGADGKMLDQVVCNVDNILYYFVMGKVSQGEGTVEINGQNYTIDANGKIDFTGTCTDASGQTLNYVNGVYKYIPQNGVYGDYLYINDVLQVRYQLASFDGDLYFINDGNKIAKNVTLYLGANFVSGKTFADGTPIPVGYYKFDAEGKMVVLNGVVDDYIYINGIVQQRYQLFNYNGDYYFISDGNKINKNITLYLSERYVEGKTFANGDPVSAGLYYFDAEGKMVIPA